MLLGASYDPSQGTGSQRPPNFRDLHARIQHEKLQPNISHGNQTRCEENFCLLDHKC